MSKKKKIPRFLIADNPMCGDEIYIEVHGKERGTIRVHDGAVVEGNISEKLKEAAAQWYISYLNFINR